MAPEVVFHPSVIERFALAAPGLSGSARRILRTNQRFIARRVVPQLHPPDAALPRERAKAPYSPAQIAGYLALADAQPTAARRMRAAGLVCLGAGAGLIRGDLRQIRGTDVITRSGGVIVAVRGARPRVVPVLARYDEPLLAAAAFAGAGLVTGGTDTGRKNLTARLNASLAGGAGCPGWRAAGCAPPGWPRPPNWWGSPRSCTRPGSPARSGLATWPPSWSPRRGRGGAAAWGHQAAMIPLAVFEEIIDASGVAPRIEAMLPTGVRPRQLRVRTLLAGMCLAQADHRPAHLTRVHQALTRCPKTTSGGSACSRTGRAARTG